jgi:Rrf2 family cysteine metabolism transcriptional repressor
MLKVSTRGRYGLIALVELACAHGSKPVQLTTIADKHGLSRKYLHNLMTTLRSAGLVRSTRGARGGFHLAGDPAALNLKDILLTLEGSGEGAPARAEPGTVVDEVLAELDRDLHQQLAGWTLDRLAARARQRAGQLMFYI